MTTRRRTPRTTTAVGVKTDATEIKTGEVTIETHPVRHDWKTLGPRDYVLSWRTHRKNGANAKSDARHVRVPLQIKRVESCPACPTTRLSFIHVPTWEEFKKKRYVYVRGVRIVRLTKAEFRRKRFIERTDLPREVSDLL